MNEYQYTRVMSGFDLPRQKQYRNEVTETFASDRLAHLDKTAAFRRIDLHWCLTLEPSQAKAFQRKPDENVADTSRMLSDLEKTATLLEGHLGSSLGLKLLGKDEAFQFFSYLFNLEEWSGRDQLRADTGVDRQIVKSPVAWHSDHVQIGKRHVQMFSLKTTPEASRPCLFSGLLTLDCDSVVCSTWRVKSTSAARSEIDAQEKFISFFKVGVLTRVMSGRDTASLETGAGAKAANNSVDDLSDVIRSLDKKAQGEFSYRLLLAAQSPEQLRDAAPTVHRIFVDARAQVMEETLGNLSAFYAMFPGNHRFNVFPLWLAEDHHARLSSVFAPHIGHLHSEDLDSEYLNIFETRTRTPFFQDVYVDGVRVMLIIGPTGTGKSSFARKHFLPTEVVSSDFCRALVSDNENDQSATGDAFDLLHEIVRKRLARGRLSVVDATNVQPEARKSLIALAKEFHLFAEAIVFDLSERVCQDRNVLRPDRRFGPHVIRNQSQQLRRSLRGLEREGIRHVFKLSSPEEVDAVTIERHPLWNNKKAEHGPFDVIGDVHGCFDELIELMAQLGYTVNQTDGAYSVSSSGERKLVFVGDLVDRGPGTVQVLRLVSSMVQSGQAFCVPGNHDMKLVRALRGRDVKHTHGLAETMEQLGNESNEFRVEVAKFLDGLVSHYVFDDGKLVVAHAGLKESMHGRGSGAVREFALFGETTGETDEFGLPIRYNWVADYRGKALVVYGHTPVPEPLFLNNTVNIDTGCVFGGRLTALRYPEREIVSVKAHQTYYEPARPFLPETTESQRPLQHAQDDVLDLADVVGKRLIDTRLKPKITIREENAIAALEVMSRFASDPKWLIYLPPTMSPTETSKHENLLEHPDEAFAFYRKEGIATVVCEQKHMGSRAVVVLCKDETVSQKRFGVV